MDKYGALKKFFGYTSFREGQEEIIDSILSGHDTVGIMPTGGGKSICFQIPALLFDGITVVVSPLISLMKDQVGALVQNGIGAAYINGSLTPRQISAVYRRAFSGMYKIIYIAPERLEYTGLQNLSKSRKISMICVDEAHCVSQWGQDFRPSYLSISRFVEALPYRPVVAAFTATATKRVKDDIVKLLNLNEPFVKVLSFDRSNLYFEVVKPESKGAALRRYLDLYSSKSGIVYCSSRKKVEELYEQLSYEGYSVAKYHAGMRSDDRKLNQDYFINDDKEVIIATNAFGMGIDKSNVSFVIHYNMPGDIESYYQEAGRAGRDGNPADCVLLYGPSDIRTQLYFIDNPEDNGELSEKDKAIIKATRKKKLFQMTDYAKSEGCLRNYILSYFGENHEEDCMYCSVCDGGTQSKDITVESQKILSCIARTNQKEKAETVIDILKGIHSERVDEEGYASLSTFAIMENYAASSVREIIDFLLEKGYAQKNEDGVLSLTTLSRKILFEKKHIRRPLIKKKAKKELDTEKAVDGELLFRLKKLRKELAYKSSVPAFIVLSDAVLKLLASEKPKTKAEMLKIPGIGELKMQRYGSAFLKEINKNEKTERGE